MQTFYTKNKEFFEFALVCEKIKNTTSKLEKISILGEFLKSLNVEDLEAVIRFISGKIFPPWLNKEIFIGYSTIISTLLEITSVSKNILGELVVKYGDLGEASFEIFNKYKRISPLFQQNLTIKDVYESFKKISEYKGEGVLNIRKNILRKLLVHAKPLEAKYIIKILLNEIRIGLSEGLLEESLAYSFNVPLEIVRDKHLILPDLGEIARYLKENKIEEIQIELLKPTNFMLADFMNNSAEIINYFSKPLIAEFKFDGIRAQIHKKGNKVKIFSRKLEDITFYLPEIVETCEKIKHDFIFDTEILSFKNNKPLPFTLMQRRLRRKYISKKLLEEIPFTAIVYDILYFNDKILINKPLRERKEIISSLELKDNIISSNFQIVRNSSEIDELFEKSISLGFEGLMIKDPDSEYTPGKRGKSWIKLKKEFDTLDCVIVAAEYGHGKRAGILSDYTFAVLDENGELKVIGKAYSGLTDDEIEFLDKKLRSIIVQDLGYKIIVRPEIVVEVAFDSIQKSDRHDSGFALRFPRIKRLRLDKSVEEIDTIEKVIEIANRKLKIHGLS